MIFMKGYIHKSEEYKPFGSTTEAPGAQIDDIAATFQV